MEKKTKDWVCRLFCETTDGYWDQNLNHVRTKMKRKRGKENTLFKGCVFHLFGDHRGILGGAGQVVNGGHAHLGARNQFETNLTKI